MCLKRGFFVKKAYKLRSNAGYVVLNRGNVSYVVLMKLQTLNGRQA